MKEKSLLIISYGKYPNGNAGAVRQHAFAKLFMELGYEVTVIGMGDSTNFQLKEYDGVKYISFRKEPNHTVNRALNWILYGKRLKQFLKKHENEYSDILFIKSYFASVLSFIKRYAKKNGVVLYHDSVEWYSPEEFSAGRLAPGYIKNNRLNTKQIDTDFNVIAISRFLEEHYTSRGIHTIRIPVIMDVEGNRISKKAPSEHVVISYAGRIGKKDYIANIIAGFLELDSEYKSRVEFRLMGANAEQVSKITGIPADTLQKNDSLIQCMGRVPRDTVLKNLAESDYTILVRDASLRYAKAGFPTKVVESLMSSTPVICNISSDLGEYLVDGDNAVIVSSKDKTDVCEALKRAIDMSPEKRTDMQKKARETAEKHFDYRAYVHAVDEWRIKNERDRLSK